MEEYHEEKKPRDRTLGKLKGVTCRIESTGGETF